MKDHSQFPCNLTEREARILDSFVKVSTNKAIAQELNLSEVTVKNAFTEIHSKVYLDGDRVLLALWWDRQTRKAA